MGDNDPVRTRGRDIVFAVQPDRFLGKPAEELGCIENFPFGIRKGFAVLEADQPCQVLRWIISS